MPEMRAGDWICPACGNHNFASRQSCNKCGGPREDGAAGGFQAAPRQFVGQQRFNPYPAAQMMMPMPMQFAGGAAPSNLKEGDWMCPGCGNHNFASRVNCNRCQELKPGAKQGDWICRENSCKNLNFASRDACNKCSVPRPADAQLAVASPGGHKHGPSPSGAAFMGGCGGYGGKGSMGQGFGCGGYGAAYVPQIGGMRQVVPYMGAGKGMGKMMMQPQMMPQYAMPMVSGNMKEGDWMCPNCMNHNFASRVNCNKCNVIRAGFKDGDWICKGCKNHNFKSRTECNKCQQPKP